MRDGFDGVVREKRMAWLYLESVLCMAWRSVQRAFNELLFGAGRWQMVMKL